MLPHRQGVTITRNCKGVRPMFRRFFFVVFFCLGGFLFYVPKWVLMGTKGGRDRKKILKQQAELLKRTG